MKRWIIASAITAGIFLSVIHATGEERLSPMQKNDARQGEIQKRLSVMEKHEKWRKQMDESKGAWYNSKAYRRNALNAQMRAYRQKMLKKIRADQEWRKK